MINIIYGKLQIVGLLSIPLIIYHVEQLIIGSIFVIFLKRWVNENEVFDLVDLTDEVEG